MKLTKEALRRIIKEEMQATLKELSAGPSDFAREAGITDVKWLALEKLLGWESPKENPEEAQAIENYFKNQNNRNWKAVSLELDGQFGEEIAKEIKSILVKKDTV